MNPHWSLWLPLVAGAALILVATDRFGLAIWPDSVNYMLAAEGLARAGELVHRQASPLVHWPPLYPAILSIGARAGFDLPTYARWLNLLCFALTGWILHAWVAAYARGSISALAMVLFISAPTILSVHSFMGTEPLFILWVSLFLYGLWRVGGLPNTGTTVLLAVVAALACLTRYVGVTLVAVGGLVLFCTRGPLRDRLVRATLFAAVASAPLVLWLLRNLHGAGSLAGDRPPSSRGFATNVYIVLREVGNWTGLEHLPDKPRAALFGVLLAGLALAVIRSSSGRDWLNSMRVPLLYCAIFPGFLVMTSSVVRYDAINDRLLAPLFVPLLVVAMNGLEHLWTKKPRSGMLLIGVVVLVGVERALSSAGFVHKGYTEGPGSFTSAEWRESELVQRSSAIAADPRPLYSNVPGVVYVYAGRMPQLLSPNALDELARSGGDVILILFENSHVDYRVRVGDIPAMSDVMTALPRAKTETLRGGRVLITGD